MDSFNEYYSHLNEGSNNFSGKAIVILNADGCGGCMDAVLAALSRSKCENDYTVIFIAKFKKEVEEYALKISKYNLLFDSNGEFYKILDEPMKSLHYFIGVTPTSVEYSPITPQNLNEFIFRIDNCD